VCQADVLRCSLGDLEASGLKLDDLIQTLKPFVESHKPVIILGNLCVQSGHEVFPPLTGDDAALPSRVPGIPELPPDVYLPGEVGGYQEIWHRTGKAMAGSNIELVFDGSGRRVEAGFVHPRASRETEEGKEGPTPRLCLVVDDPDFLSQELQLLVDDQCLVDQARKDRIIEKLFYRDLS
jgi:hypothetical protein